MKTQMHDYIQNIIEAIKFYTNKLLRKSVANWEQNDETQLDYVKGRTHWDSRNSISNTEAIIYTFDGTLDTEEKITVIIDDYTYYLVRLCDSLSKEELIGAMMELYDQNHELYTTLDITEDSLEDYNSYLDIFGGTMYNVFDEATIDGYTIPSGLYTSYNDSDPYVGVFTHNKTIIIEEGELVQLDPKYIPDSIARVSDVESALSDSSTAVNEQLDSLRSEITEDLEEKVNVFQGTENADTMLIVDEEGYVTLTPIATEEDTLNMLTELELIDPMTDESGALLTDENGAVYIL